MRPQDIEPFLDRVERSAGKSFRYRREIAALIAADEARSAGTGFAELTFLGKFLVNASHILRRTGLASEETAKLSAEFSATVEKVANLVRNILGHATEEVRTGMEAKFLAADHTSLAELLSLADELAWIKNYELDRAAKN